MVDADAVVETASEAAHGYVFSRLNKSTVDDIDLAVSFEDDVFEVEISIIAPEADDDLEEIADEAVRVAGDAVEELFDQA